MGHLFSKSVKKSPQPSRVTEHDKAVLELKVQRDNMKMYRKKIELNLEKERRIAKELLRNGKKERALVLLKKKRYQEQLIERTTKQLDNMERMVHDLEFAQVEMQVLEGLKAGNESLKKMNEMMKLEDVEKIMEETREAVEYQQEIDRLVSGSLSDVDMSEIESELDQILDSLAEEEGSQLPDVPTDTLPEGRKEPSPGKSKERRKDEPLLA